MRHQQVSIDYAYMVKTSFMCLLVVFSGWILLKLVQAIFWFPRYLEDHQKRLYEVIQKHENAICSKCNDTDFEQNSTTTSQINEEEDDDGVAIESTKPEEKKIN